MNLTKNWNSKEDQALLTLYRDRNFRKWTQISQLLYKQYGIKGKTPKKCRERFKNHLDPSINKSEWTAEEEATLMALQTTLGNKWAQISRMIPGRTDDSIKNKFFSKYRKAIRNINNLRSKSKNLKIKELKIGFVYKLMNFIDKSIKSEPTATQEPHTLAQNIKSIIISFQTIDRDKQQTNLEELQDLAAKIQLFSNRLKNKTGRRRGRKVSATNRNTAVIQATCKNITAQPQIMPFSIESSPKKEEKSLQLNIGPSRLYPFTPLPLNTRFDEESQLKQGEYDKVFLHRNEESDEYNDVWKTPIYGIHHSSQYLD